MEVNQRVKHLMLNDINTYLGRISNCIVHTNNRVISVDPICDVNSVSLTLQY